MNKRHLESPIFVTGIERSGSSIVAKIINLCGAFAGPVTEMQENKAIKDMVSEYYEKHLFDPMGQYPLPQPSKLDIPVDWKNRVNTTLLSQKYQEDRSWMCKSAKLAQIWPIWHYAYPNAKWIIVRRRTGDIIQSCLHTGFMKAYKKEEIRKKVGVSTEQEGWLWWVHEQEKQFVSMIEFGVNCKVLWPERMVYGDYGQMQETIEWLGLQWNLEIEKIIFPLFNNSPQKEKIDRIL